MTTPHELRALSDQADAAVAAARLSLADAVGLALRAHRRVLGLSQRAYAAWRHRSPSTIARLETSAGRFRLDDVVAALAGTGYALALTREPDADDASAEATIVAPDSWPHVELLARVRDGSRRFPAHHDTRAVLMGPAWWWHREFFDGGGPEPEWYAPRPLPPPPGQQGGHQLG